MAMLGLIERLKMSGCPVLRPREEPSSPGAPRSDCPRSQPYHGANLAGFERQRRHAALVALSLDLTADLTDKAIDLFDR